MRWLLLACILALPAQAADLAIGRAGEQSSLDPQFASTGVNIDTALDMFDGLVTTDAQNQTLPALAASWRVVDPTTWEIKLRPDVSFHDGSRFTAADVVFSLQRVSTVANSPAPYLRAVRGLASVEAIDPLTVRIKTTSPTPSLIEQVGTVFMLSAKAAAGMNTSDLNAGKGMIGTGPYRFDRWQPGQRLDMTRNDAYWGGKPAWDHVSLRYMPAAGSRVAALLAGDVDLIEQVPPADAKQLAANPKLSLFSIASTRIVYLAMDSSRARSPFVTDNAGKPLDRNPLMDSRVRQAISKMIDRNALTSRLLDGSAEPAGQMVPQGLGGFDPALPPPPLDLAGAKRLLADAGWPQGFGITLHSSSDRLPQDGAVAQALGQMLKRGGLTVNAVVAQPYNVYAPAASRQEYSLFLFSFGTGSSNAAESYITVLTTYDPDHGMGTFNRARYSNPQFDALLKQALGEFDETKRNDLLRQATHVAFTDAAIVPLYWQIVHWAARKGIAYVPRRGEDTAARYAKPD